MNLEKLKALLESGSITQEEYESMAKAIGESTDPETTDPETKPESEPTAEPITMEQIERLVQSRVDKLMAPERKKYAETEKKYKNLQQQLMTADEVKQAEIAEKEEALAAREKELQDRLNREYAQKALREAGLDDGSETAFALVDFVIGEDEAAIDEKVKSFKELFNKAVTAEVNKRFKENGRTPQKSTNLNGGKNPFTKEQWNITEQMAVEIQNPELAAQLKAAAGVK